MFTRSKWCRMIGASRTGFVTLALAVTVACAPEVEPKLQPILTLQEGGASNPTVAIDAETGVTYVAWVGREADSWDVYLAGIDAEGVVNERVRVNDVAGEAAPHLQAPAQVAAGPNGHVYVVWQTSMPIAGRRFPASDLRFARSTDGGKSFEPAIAVNDDPDDPPTSHTFHNILVAPDGTIYASWIDAREVDRRRRLEHDHGAAEQHHGISGSVVPAGPEIRVASSVDGGQTFGASVVVDTSACPCCRTAMTLGADGTLYIAWRKLYDGNVRDIVVAHSTNGGNSFTAPQRVHHDGWSINACPHAGPSIAMDAAGTLHVGWYTGQEERRGLHYAKSTNGGLSFDYVRGLLVGPAVGTSQVKMAAGQDGHVWFAWEDATRSSMRVRTGFVASRNQLRALSEGAAVGSAPAVAAGAEGAVFAWLDGDAVRVQAAH